MIPVEQLSSRREWTSSNGVNLQFHSIHDLTATKSCALRVASGNLGRSSGFAAQRRAVSVRHSNSRNALRSFQLSPPNISDLSRPRRWGGTTDVKWSLDRFPFLWSDGALQSDVSATGAATAASADDFSSQSQEQAWRQQNSTALLTEPELQDKPAAMNAGHSGEDDDGGKVEKTTTVLQEGDQESGAEMIVQEEYKLTEEGTLSTVKVTRGEKTNRTNTKVDRVLAEVGMQADSLQSKIKNFSLRKLIRDWGKKQPELQDLKFNAAMYEPKEGVSNIVQWTATELTLQRAQLVRISKDSSYLVWAFALFGGVRILEGVAAVFATNPPNFMKLTECMNALDPLTVASLAHELRKPVVGMLEVDPTNLQEVSSLKSKFWSELHKFYERQWKVVATLGIARLLTLIVTHLPKAEWVTSKVKVIWDISMALPIF